MNGFTLLALGAIAESAGPEAPPDLVTAGLMAFGIALNTAGVWFLVALVRIKAPWIREEAPHALPILALIAGPTLNALGAAASEFFLVAVDLGPLAQALEALSSPLLIGELAGASAVAMDQIYRQKRKAGPGR